MNLLGTGSNDSGVGRPQACTNVIGINGITAANCDEVSKAVLATEMIGAGTGQRQPGRGHRADTHHEHDLTGNTTGATRQANENAPCWVPVRAHRSRTSSPPPSSASGPSSTPAETLRHAARRLLGLARLP